MGSSIFRGTSGEVVGGFVHPRTFLTLVPVTIAVCICELPVMALFVGMALPEFVLVPLALVVVGPVLGRFALAARDGRLTAGFVAARPERAPLLGFVARYSVIMIVWTACALLAVGFVPGWLGASTYGEEFRPETPLGTILGVGVGMAAALVAIVLAARTESVPEAVGFASLRWLLGERRGDLVVLLATFVGASATFTLMAWPVGRALEPIVGTFVRDLGFEPFSGLAWVVPVVGLVVLGGRLGGAFNAERMKDRESEDDLRQRLLASGELPPTALAVLTNADSTPASPPPIARTVEVAAPMRTAADRLGAVPDDDLGRAVIEAEQLMRMEPHKPNVAAELARLYQRADCPEESRRVAGVAIERALAAAMSSVAAQVFHRFDPEERDGFGLTLSTLEQLGWLLLRRKEIEGALWCFETFGREGGSRRQLEKGLVAIADAVALDGDHLRAIALHRSFLRHFPESPSADYVRSTLVRLDATTRRPPSTRVPSPAP